MRVDPAKRILYLRACLHPRSSWPSASRVFLRTSEAISLRHISMSFLSNINTIPNLLVVVDRISCPVKQVSSSFGARGVLCPVQTRPLSVVSSDAMLAVSSP